MDRKTKTIFQLDSPYSHIQWPELRPADQEAALELLTSYLTPIGSYRSTHLGYSKGKRGKKRKRQKSMANCTVNTDIKDAEIPSPPQRSQYVLVGLNSITRHLESLSRRSRPACFQQQSSVIQETEEEHGAQLDNARTGVPGHVAAIFVSRSSQPSALHAYLPRLISTASLAHPLLPPTRLVQLPNGSEDYLSSSLHLPRAAFVGIIDGAPYSKPLVDFVLEHVPAINVSWMVEMCSAQYRPVNIKATKTTNSITTRSQRISCARHTEAGISTRDKTK